MEELVSWNHANLPEIPGIKQDMKHMVVASSWSVCVFASCPKFQERHVGDMGNIDADSSRLAVKWVERGDKIKGARSQSVFFESHWMYPFGIFTKRVNLICLGLKSFQMVVVKGSRNPPKMPQTIQVGHNFPEIIFS